LYNMFHQILRPTLLFGSLLVSSISPSVTAQPPDTRALLDEAREISYQAHWREAQAILDQLAPYIDQAGLREYADYQLLQARHLALDDQTEQSLALADQLLERNLEPDQRLRALQFRANIAVLLRRYEVAFESLSEALDIEVDVDDPQPVIATLNMAAYMFGRAGEYERGAEYGQRALALARETGQAQDACIALQRLAPVYKWAKQYEQAKQTYREGISTCGEVGNLLFAGVHRHGLADLLRRDGDPEAALLLSEQSIEALDDGVFTLGEFEARLIRAETLQDLGRLDQRWDEELQQLNVYFTDRALWDQSARLHQLKSERAAAAGDFELALEQLHAYNEARESFLGRERSMRLAYLQVEFDSSLQRQQIELLRETARAAQLEARASAQQQRLRTFGWLLAALIVLVLAGILYRLQVSRRRFQELSRIDGLSGLVNHTWFFERAQAELDRFNGDAGNSGRIVLIAADIDHFKQVNDEHGHRVGDRVLGRTARRLQETFPEDALVGRIGGEEFAVLMQVDDVNHAIGFIERFRNTDQKLMRAGDPPVTISFGVSCAKPEDDIQTLRNRADQALYAAKASGRDRYEVDSSCAI